MHLIETRGFNAGEERDSNANKAGVIGEELDSLVILAAVGEDGGVRDHVEAHEEVQE